MICESLLPLPFSNSENMTPKYPDIVARLPGLLRPGVTSLVLDTEAVAWDPAAKKVLPFQVGRAVWPQDVCES